LSAHEAPTVRRWSSNSNRDVFSLDPPSVKRAATAVATTTLI
jgi:hypothetical protein